MPARARIGILLCDHIDESLREAAGGDYPQLYGRFFDGDPHVVTVDFDAVNGELPTTHAECDGWLLTGSRHDAATDDAWILALIDWVRGAVDGGARVAGICFGHQLVARALGGRVERGEQWAVGPHALHVERTPWFGGGTVHLEASHRDVVSELPPGAVSIGVGTSARHPAFRVADNVLCVQDHPEFTERYIESLIKVRRERIGADIADAALAALRTCPNDGPTVGGWIADFLLDRRVG